MKKIYMDLGIVIPFTIGQKCSDHFTMIDEAQPNDIWFHLEDYPSCHIIASIPEYMTRTQLKKVIRYGYSLSKTYSKHGSNVKVIHARVRNLKKTETEGCVVVNF
jgi:hypothetical protein